MALNYKLTDIDNYNNLCWFPIPEGKVQDYRMSYTTCEVEGKEYFMNSVTNTLIWATMSVGISEITNKNWKDFYVRIHLLEELGGTFLNKVNKLGESNPRPIEEKDVKDHIGLSTNAENLTELKFIKRHIPDRLKVWRKGCE